MIGVIGGTGNTGRTVVAALQAKAAEFRCLVRDTAAAAETLGSDVELVGLGSACEYHAVDPAVLRQVRHLELFSPPSLLACQLPLG